MRKTQRGCSTPSTQSDLHRAPRLHLPFLLLPIEGRITRGFGTGTWPAIFRCTCTGQSNDAMADGWCGSLISIDLLDPRVASLQASDCPRTLYSLMVFLGPTMRMRRRRRRFDSMTISRSCEGCQCFCVAYWLFISIPHLHVQRISSCDAHPHIYAHDVRASADSPCIYTQSFESSSGRFSLPPIPSVLRCRLI